MIKKEGSCLYLEIAPDTKVKELLENALEKYKDIPDLKKEYIEFIITNNLHNYINKKIFLSEPLINRSLKMKGFSAMKTERDIFSIKKVFELLYNRIMAGDFSDGTVLPVFFYKKGDVVAELSVEKSSTDDNIDVSFNTESFDFSQTDNLHIYKAKKSGYLTYNNEFILMSPVRISAVSVSIIYIPVIFQKNELIDFIYNYLNNFIGKYPESPFIKIPEKQVLENSSEIKYFTAVKGKAAVNGKSAEIVINDNTDKEPDSPGKADYRSFTKYKVVNKNQLLFKKIKMIPHVSGIDIYGKTIIPEESEDIVINSGENIRTEEDDCCIRYYAEVDGLFTFNENNAFVDETLTINGNVDYSTGNIDFPKSIIIKGDVLYGFSVKSGKNIVVEGCLEDAVFLKCSGNLFVGKGIMGKTTKIECDGDLYANYINNADIYCKGNISIEKSVIGGNIFSEKSIEVKGSGIKKENMSFSFRREVLCYG